MWARIRNLVSGFMSLFVSGLEKQNPRALIEAEKENLRKQIARFNDNLATHAGFCERLMRQVKNQEVQDRDLTAKAAANLKVGNRAAAGQYALQLKTVKEQIDENRSQLQAAEETFKKLVQARDISVKEAHEKIEQLKRMLTETEMLEAQAELQEMAQGMISSIGGSGDTVARVEEYLTERRDKAAGRARVAATSIDSSKVELMEAEQQALADQALVEFAASYGLEMPPGAASQGATPSLGIASPVAGKSAAEAATEVKPPQKDMGPAAKQSE
jgi:phage shock protein A